MRKQDYKPVEETVFDLYTEKERVVWYVKLLAILSTWFPLVGYILFTLAYSAQDDDARVKRYILAGVGAGLLGSGYILALIATLKAKSLLFCYDTIFIPGFATALKGIFITLVYKAVPRQPPNINSAYVWGPFATALVMLVVSFSQAVWAKVKLRRVKDHDTRRRQRVVRSDRESYGADSSSMELLGMHIPETEAQRQQLLKLLLQRENARAPSPDSVASTTYHIDLPSEYNHAPQPYLSPTLPWTATSPRKPGLVPAVTTRGRSPTTESFKDPRELKRERIERSSVSR